MNKKLKGIIIVITIVIITLCALVLMESLNNNKSSDIDSSKQTTQNLNRDQDTAKDTVQNEDESTFAIYGPIGESMILENQPIEIKEGQTVFEVSLDVFKQNKLQFEYSGLGSTAYIKGINNLYEFDKGPESGWLYKVNGEFPDKSCGAYKAQPGDKIEWLYTLDLGKDVGSGERDLGLQGE